MKKLLVSLVAVAVTLTVAVSASALPLPWLDFGSNLIWNSNTNTLSDGGYAYVDSITYLDGTSAPPPHWPTTDGVIYSAVALNVSFDGDNSNDTILISDGSTDWLSADLDVVSPAPDPLAGTPNPYRLMLESDNISVATGQGSQWADEFASRLNLDLLYPAALDISFNGSYFEEDDGVYKVNSDGKVAPVPEPGTLAMFGFGIAGLYYVRRSKTFKL